MNFNIEQLVAFVEVYESRSINRAAVKLGKHRTTIGQVIIALEDSSGVKLFNKKGKSLLPTKEGDILYHHARHSVSTMEKFEKVALNISLGAPQNINISYFSFFPFRVLLEVRRSLILEFPNLNVNFIVRDKVETKKGIKNGDVDFGFVNIYESKIVNSIDHNFLFNIPCGFFTGKSSALVNSTSESLTKMKNVKQLILSSMIDDGLDNKIKLSSNYDVIEQYALLIELLQVSDFWAILPITVVNSLYSDFVSEITIDEINERLMIPVALWSPPFENLREIRNVILKSVLEYKDDIIF